MKKIKFQNQRDFYNFMFGEEFMNSPVEGTKEEAKFIEQKLNEFRERNKLNK